MSFTAILAIHGGDIEPGTSEIARSIAEDGDRYNLYLFEGHKREKNRILHITSSRFDEPQALALASKVDRIVSVHGMKGEEPFVLLGGLDLSLRERIKILLVERGFCVNEEKGRLDGSTATNITNRSRQLAGVQLEISRALRDLFFSENKREGRWTSRQQLLFEFVKAIQMAIDQ